MFDLVHRTYPRLLTTGLFFFSSIVFSVLTVITFFKINEYTSFYIYLILLLITSGTSCISLFHLLKTKTIYITKTQLIVSNFFFPNKTYYNLSEIRTIRQSKKTTTNYLSISVSLFTDNSDKYKFTSYNTIIEIIDKENIPIGNSIGNSEFEYLYKAFSKQKRGEGKVKKIKHRFLAYLIFEIGGLLLSLLLFFLTLGLLISLTKN
jgi:hypothetical protein